MTRIEKKCSLMVELSADAIDALAVLAARPGDDATDAERATAALEYLADCCAAGVTRPGSWERGWLRQAFGDDWRNELEPDPDCDWRHRRKVRS